MSSNTPQLGDVLVDVTMDIFDGAGGSTSLLNYIRRNFFASGQVQQGDGFMVQSRGLLDRHLQLIQLSDQTRIRHDYTKARDAKEKLDDFDGSKFQKYFQARNYRRRAKKSFKFIQKASDRAIDDRFMDQIVRNERGSGGGGGTDPDTGPVEPTPKDPFTDSHAISTLTSMAANDIDGMDMSTFQNEDTGESAVVFDVHGRDSSTEHIVTTMPTEVLTGDRTDGEATVALSIHKEDGSSPRLIITPLPNASPRSSADEEAETRATAPAVPIEAVESSRGRGS